MHTRLFAALAALVVILAIAPAAAKTPQFDLRVEGTVFVEGPKIAESFGGSCDSAECYTIRINVLERGDRLRIGLDKPEVGDEF